MLHVIIVLRRAHARSISLDASANGKYYIARWLQYILFLNTLQTCNIKCTTTVMVCIYVLISFCSSGGEYHRHLSVGHGFSDYGHVARQTYVPFSMLTVVGHTHLPVRRNLIECTAFRVCLQSFEERLNRSARK